MMTGETLSEQKERETASGATEVVVLHTCAASFFRSVESSSSLSPSVRFCSVPRLPREALVEWQVLAVSENKGESAITTSQK